MEFISNSNLETIEFAYNFGKSLNKGDVILLTGDLGCGKTTFTKGIGKALNVKKTINSPTFTILKIYKGDINLHHMDFYRLENTHLYDFDLAEYITDETINVIEWPFMKEEYLPSSYILIDLTYLNETQRKIKVEYIGEKYNKEK
jgi:tRNA threonylcarbamoyladenosine biosynthesis protein TsaE